MKEKKVLDNLHWILPALPGVIVEGWWGKELWVARVTESVSDHFKPSVEEAY